MLEQHDGAVSGRGALAEEGACVGAFLGNDHSASVDTGRGMSNEQLLASLRTTWRQEGSLMAQMIARLVNVVERGLHLELGCNSIYEFCRRQLGMSEGEAYRRMVATALVKEFPQILEALREQRIHLSNLVLLKDLFQKHDVDALLVMAEKKTKREVEAIVATLAPKPDVQERVRKLPQPKVGTAPMFELAPAIPEGGARVDARDRIGRGARGRSAGHTADTNR